MLNLALFVLKYFKYQLKFEFLITVIILNPTDSDDCKQCPRVLAEIEHIDDEADGAGINFVKIDDKQMAKEVNLAVTRN